MKQRKYPECQICHCCHPPHKSRFKVQNRRPRKHNLFLYRDQYKADGKLNMTTERPKRPLSAYMLWLNENREQIKKDNPGSKVTDIAKRGGELWRAMKDKSEWEAKAIVMKEKYTKELKEYEANGGTDTSSNKKRKSKATKPAKKQKKKETSDEESGDEESD